MKPKPRKENVKAMLKATVIRLPPDLLRRAKHTAIEHDTSIQQMVTDLLEAHLGKEAKRS
jgi:hypothetical protein